MNKQQAIESYLNGNISHVSQWLKDSRVSFGEFLALYVALYAPTSDDLVLFTLRLA